MTLTVGSLFSGIGGLDLGLERAGMTVRWNSEIDPYACRVLAKHWPHVENLGDVTAIDWSGVERVDLICGGYPCQPFSLAGSRQGAADPRHLWPRFADALRHLRPRYALLENVPGHLSLGFGRVLGDLAELGYDTEWECIPAAAVGAPHLRYRVFVVAHADGHPLRDDGRCRPPESAGRHLPPIAGHHGPARDVAHSIGTGLEIGGRERSDSRAEQPSTQRGGQAMADSEGVGRRRPILTRTDTVNDGPQPAHGHVGTRRDSEWWAVEPDVGRVAHGVPSRVDRLRTLGNAVVPQVAEWVGRRIMEAAA